MVSELKSADLILVRGTGLISKAIEDVEQSPYSHTAGYVGESQLIEANGFQTIGFIGLSAYIGTSDVYICDSLTNQQRQAILKAAMNKVGGHYDYVLLAWEFFRYEIHRILPYREGKNVRICSTLWSDAYREAGIDLCPGIKFPSPGDLANSKLLRKVGSL